jgi:hypothetical protein
VSLFYLENRCIAAEVTSLWCTTAPLCVSKRESHTTQPTQAHREPRVRSTLMDTSTESGASSAVSTTHAGDTLDVFLHPLVMMNIADQFTRMRILSANDPRSYLPLLSVCQLRACARVCVCVCVCVCVDVGGFLVVISLVPLGSLERVCSHSVLSRTHSNSRALSFSFSLARLCSCSDMSPLSYISCATSPGCLPTRHTSVRCIGGCESWSSR